MNKVIPVIIVLSFSVSYLAMSQSRSGYRSKVLLDNDKPLVGVIHQLNDTSIEFIKVGDRRLLKQEPQHFTIGINHIKEIRLRRFGSIGKGLWLGATVGTVVGLGLGALTWHQPQDKGELIDLTFGVDGQIVESVMDGQTGLVLGAGLGAILGTKSKKYQFNVVNLNKLLYYHQIKEELAQYSTGVNPSAPCGRKLNFFQVSFEREMGIGASAAWLFNPLKGGNYLVGAQYMSVVQAQGSQHMEVSNSTVQSVAGDIKSRTNVSAIELVQRYLIFPRSTFTPCVSFNLGWRTVSQDVKASYTYYDVGGPLTNLHLAENLVTSNPNSSFSFEAGLGCRIRFWRNESLFLRIGLRRAQKAQLVDWHSVRYDNSGFHYKSYFIAPTSLTFGLGVMI